MSPETLQWLRQFDGFDLSPHERLALAYLRVNEWLYNRDYVRLTGRTSVEATQDLRRIVDKGALVMQSTRGGAYYVLPKTLPPPSSNLFDAALTDEERVLQLVKQKGKIDVKSCIEQFGLSRDRASKLLRRLVEMKHLQAHGKLRWRYYTLS
jgi:predicted HTH transcriptional regulator